MVIKALYVDYSDGNGPIKNPALTDAEWNALKADTDRQQTLFRLSEIDQKSIRPSRAIAAGTATQADIDYLAALEAEAAALRVGL